MCFGFFLLSACVEKKILKAAMTKTFFFLQCSTVFCLMLDSGSIHPWVPWCVIKGKILRFVPCHCRGAKLYSDFLSRLGICTQYMLSPSIRLLLRHTFEVIPIFTTESVECGHLVRAPFFLLHLLE